MGDEIEEELSVEEDLSSAEEFSIGSDAFSSTEASAVKTQTGQNQTPGALDSCAPAPRISAL